MFIPTAPQPGSWKSVHPKYYIEAVHCQGIFFNYCDTASVDQVYRQAAQVDNKSYISIRGGGKTPFILDIAGNLIPFFRVVNTSKMHLCTKENIASDSCMLHTWEQL